MVNAELIMAATIKYSSHCAKCYISIISFIPFNKPMYKLFYRWGNKVTHVPGITKRLVMNLAQSTKKAKRKEHLSLPKGGRGIKTFLNKEMVALSINRILESRAVKEKNKYMATD